MDYRILGSTGLKVSVIGFGGIPVQRIDIDETKRIFMQAEILGINFLDSARAYSVSEEYIGHAISGRRDKWIIATKSMAREKEAMLKDVEISLQKLQTDYIDLYQLHNVRTLEEYNKVLNKDGAYEALEQMKREGKIGHIGITSHSLDILKLAVESKKFETIMYPYNIVETQAEEVFERADKLNIGVIAMKPLAGGNIENAALALRFIIENNSISTAIPGIASIEELEKNASVGNGFEPLSDDEKAAAKKLAESLGDSFCRRCGYCGPCTKGIDIPSMFLFKGYKERYNLSKWAEDRYFNSKATAKDCVECRACEVKCPYGLPISAMLKEVKKCFNE